MADAEIGLTSKYTVTHNFTGEQVEDCFVLRPDRDPAARAAVAAYAALTPNERLRDDLFEWLRFLPPITDPEGGREVSATARTLPVGPSHDTSKADPFGGIRDLIDWYEGLFAWGMRWRDEAWRLQRDPEEGGDDA